MALNEDLIQSNAGSAKKTKTPEQLAKENVTKLAPVDPSQVYKGPGSVLGNDIESAYWKMYNGGGGGGGGGEGGVAVPVPNTTLSLADRSKEFGDFQSQTTKYTSDLMTGAADTANGMFGQGTFNQMTGDNDQVVQADIAKLQEQFGGNVNHPAFIKAKNEMLQASKMYNARAFTDLKAKAATYGVQVGEMAKNYYDVFSSREEDQQKLRLATDQFNIDTELKKQQMAQSAAQFGASMAQGAQLAALAAITANRKFEIGMATEWANTELEARSADKVSRMNLALEMRKLDAAQATAKSQQSSNIFSTIIGGVLGAIPIIGGLFKKST